MANRLTDTTIWKKQKWFKKLPVVYKLAWKYLTDECNHAGVWKIDIPELLDDLGIEEFNLENFIDACNIDFDKKSGKKINRKRILHFNEDYVWLTGFMTFQYGGKTQIIKQNNNAVPGAIEILKSFNLFDFGVTMKFYKLSTPSHPLKAPQSPSKPLKAPPTPLKPLRGSKDKDKDKDKDINNTVLTNTGFNQKPIKDEFKELPSDYIRQCIEWVFCNQKVMIDETIINSNWDLFKTQHLTGTNFYQDEQKVYSHFINIIKKGDFNAKTKRNNPSGGFGLIANALNQG
ncbi:MAG: hypothetical protein KA161_07675 [Saprospiraceae bacterium]|nr:hypothetical protein [Saprospiraceae bacterium]